jgi:integrase
MQTVIGSSTGLSVSEILDAYLKEHVAEKVVAKDRQEYGARHLKQHMGDLSLPTVDILACRKYARQRRAEGAADSTIRRELNILSAAANQQRAWRRIGPEHLPQIELPEVAQSEQIEWFSKEQIQAMFKACNSGWHGCFIRIGYYSAGRRNSVERLLKTQVDRDRDVIHLAQPGERKTKKRRPSVPLYPEIRPAVDWLFNNSGTPFLFGRKRSFYRPFVELCESLGFEGNPHMLRHSRATHMLMDGESIYKVAKLLGDSVATVERVYGHVSVDFLKTSSGVDGAHLEAPPAGPKAGQFRTADSYP